VAGFLGSGSIIAGNFVCQQTQRIKLVMKAKLTFSKLILFALTATALGVPIQPFSSWQALVERSPGIIMARCTKTPPLVQFDTNGIEIDRRDGIVDSDIEVIRILKGETNSGIERIEPASLGAARLSAQYWPYQGEYYAVFGILYDGSYQATESYRIIPLGHNFPAKSLAGKTLDEQVKFILKWRLDRLNRELEQGEEEKKRLEEGLK
jgi:hypothetical protein